MIAQKAQRPLGGICGSEVDAMKLGTQSLVRKSQAWGLVCVCAPDSRTPSRLCSLPADVG